MKGSGRGRRQSPLNGTGPIVATGPFALRRNPIYVSFNPVYVGIALIVNRVWPIIFLPFGIALLHYGVIARTKLFSPYTGWRWYITEWAAETGLCFGLVQGYEVELGYFDLTELAESTVLGNVPAVERDLYWEPKTIGEIRRGSR